jgi:hypothetical protein
MAASFHAADFQLFARQHTHPYGRGRTSHPPIHSSATLAEPPPRPPRSDERPSIELKFRAVAPTSSMPSWSESTRMTVLSTPSRATRTARRCSRGGTAARSPPLTGTVPVRAWFSVGRRLSAKSGCHVLGLTPSTCSHSLRTLPTLTRDGIRCRSRMFIHGDSQLTWMQQSNRGIVSPLLPTTSPLHRLRNSS